MKYAFLTLMTVFSTVVASASNFADPNVVAFNALQPHLIPNIEYSVKGAAVNGIGVLKLSPDLVNSVLSSTVKWGETTCLLAASIGASVPRTGVCIATVVGDRINAKVAIIIGKDGTKTKSIYTDLK